MVITHDTVCVRGRLFCLVSPIQSAVHKMSSRHKESNHFCSTISHQMIDQSIYSIKFTDCAKSFGLA